MLLGEDKFPVSLSVFSSFEAAALVLPTPGAFPWRPWTYGLQVLGWVLTVSEQKLDLHVAYSSCCTCVLGQSAGQFPDLYAEDSSGPRGVCAHTHTLPGECAHVSSFQRRGHWVLWELEEQQWGQYLHRQQVLRNGRFGRLGGVGRARSWLVSLYQHRAQDLNSPTRDWTFTPCIAKAES